MNKKRVIAICIFLLAFIGIVIDVKNEYVYFLLLGLISFAILYSNNYKLLNANSLFTIFFIYSVGLGPFFLLKKNTIYNYDYFDVILGGLLAFGIGGLFFIKDVDKPMMDKSIIRFRMSRMNVLRILYIISMICSLYYLYINRGYLLGGNLSSGRVEAMAGNGKILYISQLPMLIMPMMYDIYYYEKDKDVHSISKTEFIVLLIISTVTLLFSGYKSPVLTMFICLIIMIVEKNNIKTRKLFILGFVLMFAVEFLEIIRGNMLSNSGSTVNIINSLSTRLVVNNINLKYIFDKFPSQINFQHGYTYLINILMLLPGPDLDFTLWLKQQLQLNFSGGGVTPTVLGEFYINFGYISIFIGMFLLGVFGNKITQYFEKHNKTFLGAFYLWQFAHCVSGGIANVMIIVLLYAMLYWILMMFPINIENKEDFIQQRKLISKPKDDGVNDG